MTLCIPITAPKISEALRQIHKANSLADWIELRLDFIEDLSVEDIPKLISACNQPVIAAYRKENPIPWLQKSLEAEAKYVDVEDINHNLPLNRCIYSIHLDHTPSLEALITLYQKMQSHEPALVKIVTTAQSFTDNTTILKFLQQVPEKSTLAFCMGEKGVLSRYFAPAYGSFCTFGTLSAGEESAPGQPMASHLKKYCAYQNTRVYGVIGDPICHSKSPEIHQACYDEQKLNALFLHFHVKPGELEEILALVKSFPLHGLAVTIPHKESIISFLDEIDEEARAIGAVNTVINRDGTLVGYNTDIFGALAPLQKRTPLNGKRVVILGGGGAAKAFIYGLKKEGAEIIVLGRNPDKLRKLSCPVNSLEGLKKEISKADILIQTTPVGMTPNTEDTLVPIEFLHPNLLVFDCVYNPTETQLLKDAKGIGCKTIFGDEMFLTQAYRQYELMTGQAPPKNFCANH